MPLHGTSACDSLRGHPALTVFRPRELFNRKYCNLTNMNVSIVTEEQYKEGKSVLGRYSTASPVSGIQKLHAFLSVRNDVLSKDVLHPVRVS